MTRCWLHLFYGLCFGLLSACVSGSGQSTHVQPVPDPVQETPVIRALYSGPIPDPSGTVEPGALAQKRGFIANYYHRFTFSLVTQADGSVTAKSGYIDEISDNYYPFPSEGSAKMTGRYRLLSAKNITRSGGQTRYDTKLLSGPITLDADFDSGRLTGKSKDIAVNAQIDKGYLLTGSVTHNGVTGDLNGWAGDERFKSDVFVVGAFQGADADQGKAFAGGLFAHTEGTLGP